jgi:cation/acetate symporter
MSTQHRTRLVNPRLGTYFGIFASAFVSLFLLLLIFEELDAPGAHLKAAVLVGPLLLYLGIAVASGTGNAAEFFAAGRRVPAVYNGLVLAVAAMGATGVVALTGLFFLDGFDTWALVIGLFSGFLSMGIAISPYLRKYGAYTVPSYLARRFESRLLRLTAASIFAVPMALVLAAEIAMGVHAASFLTGYDQQPLALLFTAALAAMIVFGGMRSIGWVATGQSIAVLIAVIVLAGLIGVIMTNLPLAQLSYGPVLRQITRLEEAQGIATAARAALEIAPSGRELTSIAARAASPGAAMGSIGFIVTTLCVTAGIAGAPWLLPRCTTTLGVYEARKSLGWAIFFSGIVIITLSAIAMFLRSIVMTDLIARSPGDLPLWFTELAARGFAAIEGNAPVVTLSSLAFARDGILFAAPGALGFPDIVLYLVLAGVIAAAFAAAVTTAFALTAILAEDVFGGLKLGLQSDVVRITTARVMVFAVLAAALLLFSVITADPLELFLSAMALSAASSFPIIVLSIWWKRLNIAGAFLGMVAGFAVALFLMLVAANWDLMLAPPVAGLVGLPIAAFVAVAASLATPSPRRAALEAVRDMRIPGGETVYDREMRLMRFEQRDSN